MTVNRGGITGAFHFFLHFTRTCSSLSIKANSHTKMIWHVKPKCPNALPNLNQQQERNKYTYLLQFSYDSHMVIVRQHERKDTCIENINRVLDACFQVRTVLEYVSYLIRVVCSFSFYTSAKSWKGRNEPWNGGCRHGESLVETYSGIVWISQSVTECLIWYKLRYTAGIWLLVNSVASCNSMLRAAYFIYACSVGLSADGN